MGYVQPQDKQALLLLELMLRDGFIYDYYDQIILGHLVPIKH